VDKFFTGVGSRKTPEDKCFLLKNLSEELVKLEYVLRSGHAAGADRACEEGANGKAHIYLPWNKYGTKPYREDKGALVNGHSFIFHMEHWPEHVKIIKEVCKSFELDFNGMREGIQKLLFRNVFQVLGHRRVAKGGKSIASFIQSDIVICYHENTGGTRYATEIAKKFKVPILNVKDFGTFEEAHDEVLNILGIEEETR